MGKLEEGTCDSDQRTGMHISRMSHRRSFGQATPVAARTLNIGTERVSLARGWRWGEDPALLPLWISQQGHLQGPR